MRAKRQILTGLRYFFESLVLEDFIKFRLLCRDQVTYDQSKDNDVLIISFNKIGPLKQDGNKYNTHYYMDILYNENGISGFFKLLLYEAIIDGMKRSYVMYWNTNSKNAFKLENNITDFCYRVVNNIYFRIGAGVIKLNTSFMEMEIERI